MPPDFSTAAFRDRLASEPGEGEEAEKEGDLADAFNIAHTTVSATYHSQYLRHGQLELWIPNQAPEFFQADAARRTGLDPSKIIIHSPLLGGFFGRHFLYEGSMA